MTTQRRPIPGYEGRYDATSDGKIISLPKPTCGARRNNEVALTPRKVVDGYLGVLLYPGDKNRKTKVNERIHRLVCAAFHGPAPAPNYTVNHKDLNKKNNAASNLEWMTAQDNMAHAIASGAYKKTADRSKWAANDNRPRKRARNKGRSKLNEQTVLLIRSLRKGGHSYAKIGASVGISRGTVGDVINGKSWWYVKDTISPMPIESQTTTRCGGCPEPATTGMGVSI